MRLLPVVYSVILVLSSVIAGNALANIGQGLMLAGGLLSYGVAYFGPGILVVLLNPPRPVVTATVAGLVAGLVVAIGILAFMASLDTARASRMLAGAFAMVIAMAVSAAISAVVAGYIRERITRANPDL